MTYGVSTIRDSVAHEHDNAAHAVEERGSVLTLRAPIIQSRGANDIRIGMTRLATLSSDEGAAHEVSEGGVCRSQWMSTQRGDDEATISVPEKSCFHRWDLPNSEIAECLRTQLRQASPRSRAEGWAREGEKQTRCPSVRTSERIGMRCVMGRRTADSALASPMARPDDATSIGPSATSSNFVHDENDSRPSANHSRVGCA
jgi:hypothetical protein